MFRQESSVRRPEAFYVCTLKVRTQTYGNRAFAAVVPPLWNSLPQHIRNSDSINILKSKLDIFI